MEKKGSTSKHPLHSLPTKHRFNIGSSDFSLLHVNPKLDLDPQTPNRSRRDGKVKGHEDVRACPKTKRKHSDEQNPSNKRLKKPVESTTSWITSLCHKPASLSKDPILEGKKTASPWRIRLHETTTTKQPTVDKTENQNRSLSDLISKAKERLQEKRGTDPKADIARQRIDARLALNKVVATVDFENHLEYHSELEQLGCGFIHDQVKCLQNFTQLPTRHYCVDESNSILDTQEQRRRA